MPSDKKCDPDATTHQELELEFSTMKPYCEDLFDDTEDLIERVVLEEVSSEVWKAFEAALSKLDLESRLILEAHFNGKSALELSEETKIPLIQIERWLEQTKQQLQNHIRRNFPVKH